VLIADLFCGAGGTSTGAMLAARELGFTPRLTAVNHWDMAIKTHELNHPEVRHIKDELELIDPKELFPEGRLDLLCASPECTHFSKARGGKPKDDQSRSGAKRVIEWAEALDIDNIFIENVEEFKTWGPLGKDLKPIEKKKGEYFNWFVKEIKRLGYSVEHKVVNCADYGDPTTRSRFFLLASKKSKVTWPDQTHSEDEWKSARSIIDWEIKGESLSDRNKPLCENTLRRIEHGIRRYVSPELVDPFLVILRGQSNSRSINDPVPTLTTGQHVALAEPFLVKMQGTSNSTPIDKPIHTITAGGNKHFLCEPFVVANYSPGYCRDVNSPLPTVTGAGTQLSVCEPFLVEYYGTGSSKSLDKPLPTVTTHDRFGIVELNGVPHKLEIRYRMLQPHELSAAMSFPKDYKFVGTKKDVVKQIGNAVPVNAARVHIKHLLRRPEC